MEISTDLKVINKVKAVRADDLAEMQISQSGKMVKDCLLH